MKAIYSMLCGAVLVAGWCVAQDKLETPVTQEREGRRPMMGAAMLEGELPMLSAMGMTKDLGLSKEQQQQIKAVLTSKTNEMATLRLRMDEAARKQVELISADKPDEAAIFQRLSEISDLSLQIAKIRVSQVLEVQRVMTPDQRTKVRAKMKERMEKHLQQGAARRKGEAGRRERPAKRPDAPAAPAEDKAPVASP